MSDYERKYQAHRPKVVFRSFSLEIHLNGVSAYEPKSESGHESSSSNN